MRNTLTPLTIINGSKIQSGDNFHEIEKLIFLRRPIMISDVKLNKRI